MRAAIGSLLLAIACALARPTDAAVALAAAHGIDPAHSHAGFSVSHLYLTRVNGLVPIVSGNVVLSAESTLPTSISATLDATRLDSGDGDRDADLHGEDWFDTKRFPTWSFSSASISAGPGGDFVASGLLTIRGIAQTVTLNVTTVRGFPHPAYHAVSHVDRHLFGMRRTPTDGLIGSDVTLTIDVELLYRPIPASSIGNCERSTADTAAPRPNRTI